MASESSKSLYFGLPLLRLTALTEKIPGTIFVKYSTISRPALEDSIRTVSTDDQGTKLRRKISENFNQLSRVHEHYRHIIRRQTDFFIINPRHTNVSWVHDENPWHMPVCHGFPYEMQRTRDTLFKCKPKTIFDPLPLYFGSYLSHSRHASCKYR